MANLNKDSMKCDSLGFVDLNELLKCSNGNLEVVLTDLGITTILKRKYVWKINGDLIEIRPEDDLSKIVRLPSKIYLTPRLIAFIGLYDGDGNKARNGGREIGFSQREINIHKFANDMLNEVFGNQFPTKWSILEDSRRFETSEMETELAKIRSEMAKGQNETNLGLIDIQREYVRREFLLSAREVGMAVDETQVRTPVISPKKGARAAGKSSLEYIQNLYGSGKFLMLWLKIVRICTDSIIANKQSMDGLVFAGTPHSFGLYNLKTSDYVRNVRWATGKGSGKYFVREIDAEYVEIGKSQKVKALIRRELKLTPFFFLVAGIYLAEGDTKKDNFFIFENIPVPLNIALTSSEPEYIEAFIRLLETIGKQLLKSWKVKVGAKYEWETEELAQRMGVITLRAGEKGQGYVRTLELDKELRNWGLANYPSLESYSNLYHHTEITGVGIPRVHIQAVTPIAPYLVSLIRNSVFNFSNVTTYTSRSNVDQ